MYPGLWATRFPEKPAVIDAASGEMLSYGELNARSNQLAQCWYAHGLRRGDRVSIFMENNLAYFVVAWAVLRSGLLLTTVNRYLTADEAAYIIDNSESRIAIASVALGEVAQDLPDLCTNCERWFAVDGSIPAYEDFDSAIGEFTTDPLEEEPAGGFLLYSSGTTGKPKGIMRPLPDGGIADMDSPVSLLLRGLWQIGEDTVYLSPAPLYHSAPIGFTTGVQAVGGTVVMMRRFDEHLALEAIEEFRVTHSQWVPTMFTRMLKMPVDQRNRYDLSSHRVAIHAAAPCPQEIKKRMLEWWGEILYEYYAGTELSGLTHASPTEWLAHPGTVGKSIMGVIHICDEEGKEMPTGEPGIVYFEAPELPFEYLKDPAKTKEVQHRDHSNWSTLGDVGYLDEEGYLYLTDRATFMIISGGVNIYPQEIEDLIVLHDKVADVAVIGVPNPEMGEEVKAVVQLLNGVEPTDDLAHEILQWTRDRLSHYKCPRSLDFRDELPRHPTGKLYKRLLKDEYWGKGDSRIV